MANGNTTLQALQLATLQVHGSIATCGAAVCMAITRGGGATRNAAALMVATCGNATARMVASSWRCYCFADKRRYSATPMGDIARQRRRATLFVITTLAVKRNTRT
ncbi:unnamed protein product [Sphagnum balticum]